MWRIMAGKEVTKGGTTLDMNPPSPMGNIVYYSKCWHMQLMSMSNLNMIKRYQLKINRLSERLAHMSVCELSHPNKAIMAERGKL